MSRLGHAQPINSNPTTLLSTTLLVILLASIWSTFPSWSNSLNFFSTSEYVCEQQQYTTEILSVDPLVIYINNFISVKEAEDLIAAGAPSLITSQINRPGSASSSVTQDRTSKSAPLPSSLPLISCLLTRSRNFLGPSLLSSHEDFDIPQLVRYTPGQFFDEHYDWYETPQFVKGKRGVYFNRVASFFVYLDEGVEGGETWFPRLKGIDDELEEKRWRNHEEGGMAFVPNKGSALFWVNLHGNGTGDRRTVHAGLPLRKGIKTAMNIWPRRYY